MNVLVTGSKGFIGKNLIMRLKEEKDIGIYEYDTGMDKQTLEKYCKAADFVYHLAGINRPEDEREFMTGNYGFTLELLDILSKYNKQCPVMLSSSIQAAYDNNYGRSKKAAEDLLLSYSAKNGADVFIFRLPNVFGKWCKPNYNSAVATFCHNIARNIPITIDDPGKEIKLVYIDDIADGLIRLLHSGTSSTSGASDASDASDASKGGTGSRDANSASDASKRGTGENAAFYEIHPVYSVSLESLADLLHSFQEYRSKGYVPDLADDFTRKLYGTYLSYLPEDDLSHKLNMHCDHRGSFTEFLKSGSSGQISVNVIKPGITKGNHYHNTKTEKFLVVSGRGAIRLKHVISGHVREFHVSSGNLEVIDIPVGYCHSIENTGSSDMVVIIWCSEIFDKDNPDTYVSV